MVQKIKQIARSLFDIDPSERLKIFFLSAAYFCIIAGYTVAKELKDTVFNAIVGYEYIPKARIIAMLVLVPAILFYALLVDRIRRYQLLTYYSMFYGVMAIVFAFFLNHPSIGMANTAQSPYRLFGWLFYFFLEGFTPFVISVFWAFSNSITNQKSAKKNYGLLVAGSKLGGMLGATIGLVVMVLNRLGPKTLAKDIINHQVLLGCFGLFCLVVPVVVYMLMKKVPGRYLHGYQAVYELEKKRSKEEKTKTGMFAGLQMLIKYPYVLGIFAMLFFYEIINSVLSYHRVRIAKMYATNLNEGAFSSSDMAFYLFGVVFCVHFIGLLISLLGTRTLLEFLGERWALILIPALNIILMFSLFVFYGPTIFIVVSIMGKSINYALGYPVREQLYIPTPKEIKFKAKSWNDAFGGKFGKTTGSFFNDLAQKASVAASSTIHIAFFAVISVFWLIAAVLLGRKFDWAVKNNAVIGDSSEGESAKKTS